MSPQVEKWRARGQTESKSDKGGEPLHHRGSLNCNLITGPPDLTQIRLKPHETLPIPNSLASHHG
ncbi:hypothetical protein F2Q69_00050328 [Brassica cretica]|uniref:Uncharacterized protein n=1 Tax=Brassica cretica TaxID=69181 RepID=A0A8S9PX91_BRACR|nr:hypothetical protein F2Q69_00050328 [Brassica cretica]